MSATRKTIFQRLFYWRWHYLAPRQTPIWTQPSCHFSTRLSQTASTCRCPWKWTRWARRHLQNKRKTFPMLLLARHGRWHCCPPKSLPQMSNSPYWWPSTPRSSVQPSATHWAQSTHTRWSFWSPQNVWQWQEIYSLHDGCPNEICWIGAPTK